jgi:hypothetical protein
MMMHRLANPKRIAAALASCSNSQTIAKCCDFEMSQGINCVQNKLLVNNLLQPALLQPALLQLALSQPAANKD